MLDADQGSWNSWELNSNGKREMRVMQFSTLRATTQNVVVGTWGLPGFLTVPSDASALVVFAHGHGSSRFNPRNREVAAALNRAGMATLLFDLLLSKKEVERARVFDISFLAERLVDAVDWAGAAVGNKVMPVGLFGASTGAAAALIAAANLGSKISAVVSRGGLPDLAGPILQKVRAPTLLIVGGNDRGVIELNRRALAKLKGLATLEIVPGATHFFAESGAMERVTALATAWFERYLTIAPT
jgi:putative phosphoribosyl transferase